MAERKTQSTELSSMKFEEALARLEFIVKSLEQAQTTLDESLSLFEEGVALVKLCNQRLDHVERRITMIVHDDESETDKEISFSPSVQE